MFFEGVRSERQLLRLAADRLKGGGTHLGYQTHYVVDGGKRRIIVGVLVAPGEVMENQPMLDLLWRVR
jgi:hypothetical protein